MSSSSCMNFSTMGKVDFEGKVAAARPSRWSRMHALLLSSGLALAIFVLDSAVPLKWALKAQQNELVFYALGVVGALFYRRFVRACSPSIQAPKAAGQYEVESSSTHESTVPQQPPLVKAAWARVSKVASQIGRSASWLVSQFKPPRMQRPGQDKPLVPFWCVCVSFLVLTSLATLLLAWVAVASTPGSLPPATRTFFDPPPKACSSIPKAQYAWRASIWLVIVFWLSSVLCAIHPLQSGLILGF